MSKAIVPIPEKPEVLKGEVVFHQGERVGRRAREHPNCRCTVEDVYIKGAYEKAAKEVAGNFQKQIDAMVVEAMTKMPDKVTITISDP